MISSPCYTFADIQSKAYELFCFNLMTTSIPRTAFRFPGVASFIFHFILPSLDYFDPTERRNRVKKSQTSLFFNEHQKNNMGSPIIFS